MWCEHCRQNVAGLVSPTRDSVCCARCGCALPGGLPAEPIERGADAPPLPGPASAAGGTVLTYRPAQGVVTLLTVGDKEHKLPGAPAAFRRFAKDRLRSDWQQTLDGRPACKGSPHLTVRALRTDGFALGDFSERPVPGCQAGGGYVAFWAVRHGQWKEVIGTQDVPTCRRLEKLGFPSELGVDECYDGTDVVPYEHP